MTGNYLKYQSNLETGRHNLATETETHRSNVAAEKETNRHNVAVETETHRHNVETEKLGWADLTERTRHNTATEQVTAQQYHESVRHNLATESIQTIQASAQQTSAVASQIQAAAAKLQSEAAWRNSETNWENARTNRYSADAMADYYGVLADAARMNALTSSSAQSESNRHNIATETDKDEELSYTQQRTQAEAFKDYSQGIRNYAETIKTGWTMLKEK